MSDQLEISPAAERASERVASPGIEGGVVAAVLFAGFVALAMAQHVSATTGFDFAVIAYAHTLRQAVPTAWAIAITNLGAAVVAVPVLIAAALLCLLMRRWTAAVFLIATLAVGYLWGSIAQNLIARIRPPQVQALITVPSAYSFPSGHSITSLLLYGAIGFLLWHEARHAWQKAIVAVVLGALIVGIGFSRVFLGVHWPTDVIGAWLLGGAWLALLAGAYLSWERYRTGPRA